MSENNIDELDLIAEAPKKRRAKPPQEPIIDIAIPDGPVASPVVEPTKDLRMEALALLLRDAPQFPVMYDDKVLTIEQGFKPAYARFLSELRKLADG